MTPPYREPLLQRTNSPRKRRARIVNLTRLGTDDGGVQTACSFIEELGHQVDPTEYVVVGFSGTPVERLSKDAGFPQIVLPRTPWARARWEFGWRRYFTPGQLCLTFHGAPWAGSSGFLLNLSGMADSNLLYPEIPFWQHQPPLVRVRKHLKDRLRLAGYARADYWLFETNALAARGVTLAGYPPDRVAVIPMSPSTFVGRQRVVASERDAFRMRIGEGVAFLFLAGANPNKRVANMAPAVAETKRRLPDVKIKVVTTLNDQSEYFRRVHSTFARHGVAETLVNLGPTPYSAVASLIDACDALCLFSVLESFSSNITEAWIMGRPLLITDADWARSVCEDAAIYVRPDHPASVADAIQAVVADRAVSGVVQRGTQRLRESFPTPAERCAEYVAHMDRAEAVGLLTAVQRSNVRRVSVKMQEA